MTSNKHIGFDGEEFAAEFLRNQGYQILELNYSTRYGEVDVIAKEGETLCFIEIKTRRTEEQGHPFEAITLAKQRTIHKVALSYLQKYGLMDRPARFDAVAVIPESTGEYKAELLRDAFYAAS